MQAILEALVSMFHEMLCIGVNIPPVYRRRELVLYLVNCKPAMYTGRNP